MGRSVGGAHPTCGFTIRETASGGPVMPHHLLLDIRPEIADAIRRGCPVVALESTLIAHGLPWPWNLETAHRAEAAVRAEGAVPATVAVIDGRPTVGLGDDEL